MDLSALVPNNIWFVFIFYLKFDHLDFLGLLDGISALMSMPEKNVMLLLMLSQSHGHPRLIDL